MFPIKKLYDTASGSSAVTEQLTCDSKLESLDPSAAAGNGRVWNFLIRFRPAFCFCSSLSFVQQDCL